MFKGFSKKQSFNGFPQNGGFGNSQFSAYGFGNCKLWLDAGNGNHLINNTAVSAWTNLINGDVFRNATLAQTRVDNANDRPSFGNRYFYGFGRTYFLNLAVSL
jgi:hypothetical protein